MLPLPVMQACFIRIHVAGLWECHSVPKGTETAILGFTCRWRESASDGCRLYVHTYVANMLLWCHRSVKRAPEGAAVDKFQAVSLGGMIIFLL